MIWTRGTRLSAATILAFLILATVSLVWLFEIQKDVQRHLAESNLWAATQAERESLQYLQILRLRGASAPETALQFEILYSRIALLAAPPQYGFFETIGQAAAVDDALLLVQALDRYFSEGDEFLFPNNNLDASAAADNLAQATHGIALATYLSERRARVLLHERERHVTNLLTASVVGGFIAGVVMASLLIRRTRKLARLRAELEEHQRFLERTVAERTDKLRDALKAEKRAKEVYRSFVITVAHQFRTSLSIIHITSLRQVRKSATELDPGMRGRFSKILDAAEQLERLISGFLETAAVQTRDFDGERSLIDFNTVVSVAVAQTRTVHPERRLQYQDTQTTLSVEGDAVLLEQAVLIILSNALKYSPPTEPVTVATWLDGDVVRCTISDRGCGIPESSIGAIFEPYYRAPNAYRFPGVGVGLSLAAKFIGLHNGRIDVTSSIGVGTTFSICIPSKCEQSS